MEEGEEPVGGIQVMAWCPRKSIALPLASSHHSLLLTAAHLGPRRILGVSLLAGGKFTGSQALNFWHVHFLW